MAEYAYVGPVSHSSGTGNLPIHRIVVHCTAGTDAGNALGTAAYFRSSAATGSAHAVTDPNKTVICATDDVVCWHAPPNPHSLGIEIECSLANNGQGHWSLPSHVTMMHHAAKWTAEKCKLHGIPVHRLTVAELQKNPNALGICGHVDVTNAFHQSTHTDPGPYFPWAQFMGWVQDEYNALGVPPTPIPTPAPSTDWLDMATQAEVTAAVTAGVEAGLANYMSRFFTNDQGTGDAIWDDARAHYADMNNGFAEMGTKLDGLPGAIAAAVAAALAPKA